MTGTGTSTDGSPSSSEDEGLWRGLFGTLLPRRSAPWLTGKADKDAAKVIRRALLDVGLCEMPPGSNRSPRIDEYNRAAGVPEELILSGRGWWCCSQATAMRRETGFPTAGKGADGSCDAVMQWCIRTGRFTKSPALGAFVFYGKTMSDAVHIGTVIRIAPYLLSVEGNAPWGGAFGSNGEAVVARRIDTDRVLGYGLIHPAA